MSYQLIRLKEQPEMLLHYSDIIVSVMAPQITSLQLFTQPFIQAKIKKDIKDPRHWPLCGEFTGGCEFPAQMASNAENVGWRHHVLLILCVFVCVI